MTLYDDVYSMKQDPAFRGRITVAVVRAAKDILMTYTGSYTGSYTAEQVKFRKAWARATMQDAERTAEQMVWGVVSYPAIIANNTGSTDAQIQTAVSASMDYFIYAADR